MINSKTKITNQQHKINTQNLHSLMTDFNKSKIEFFDKYSTIMKGILEGNSKTIKKHSFNKMVDGFHQSLKDVEKWTDTIGDCYRFLTTNKDWINEYGDELFLDENDELFIKPKSHHNSDSPLPNNECCYNEVLIEEGV